MPTKSTGIESRGARIALKIVAAAMLSIFASACSPGGERGKDPDIEANAVDFGTVESSSDEGDVAATEGEARFD